MKILRWMCDKTSGVRIRKKTILGVIGRAPIEHKMRENKLTWFGYVHCKSSHTVLRRSDMVTVDGKTKGRED